MKNNLITLTALLAMMITNIHAAASSDSSSYMTPLLNTVERGDRDAFDAVMAQLPESISDDAVYDLLNAAYKRAFEKGKSNMNDMILQYARAYELKPLITPTHDDPLAGLKELLRDAVEQNDVHSFSNILAEIPLIVSDAAQYRELLETAHNNALYYEQIDRTVRRDIKNLIQDAAKKEGFAPIRNRMILDIRYVNPDLTPKIL